MKKTLILGFAIAACMLAGAALASPPPSEQVQSYRSPSVAVQDQAAPAVAAVAVRAADFAVAPAAVTGGFALATGADSIAVPTGSVPHVLAAPGFRSRVDRTRVSWT